MRARAPGKGGSSATHRCASAGQGRGGLRRQNSWRSREEHAHLLAWSRARPRRRPGRRAWPPAAARAKALRGRGGPCWARWGGWCAREGVGRSAPGVLSHARDAMATSLSGPLRDCRVTVGRRAHSQEFRCVQLAVGWAGLLTGLGLRGRRRDGGSALVSSGHHSHLQPFCSICPRLPSGSWGDSTLAIVHRRGAAVATQPLRALRQQALSKLQDPGSPQANELRACRGPSAGHRRARAQGLERAAHQRGQGSHRCTRDTRCASARRDHLAPHSSVRPSISAQAARASAGAVLAPPVASVCGGNAKLAAGSQGLAHSGAAQCHHGPSAPSASSTCLSVLSATLPPHTTTTARLPRSCPSRPSRRHAATAHPAAPAHRVVCTQGACSSPIILDVQGALREEGGLTHLR